MTDLFIQLPNIRPVIRLPAFSVSGLRERKKKKVTPVLNVKSILRISADPKHLVADSPSCGQSPAEAVFLTEQSLEQVDAMT